MERCGPARHLGPCSTTASLFPSLQSAAFTHWSIVRTACVFALASSLLNAARQDKHWAELEQGQSSAPVPTHTHRPHGYLIFVMVLFSHTHQQRQSKSGCLGLCLQSDVVHQSVFELIHTDDRAQFRRQLHFALKPDTTLADGSVQSPSKSTPSRICSVLR